MLRLFFIFIPLFIFSKGSIVAQEWSVKVSSSVEIREWKLTTKADKDQKGLSGASIKVLKGGSLVNSTVSGGGGDFTVSVPGNGEYIVEVSYPGYNSKRFAVSTLGVPKDVADDNFKPSFTIVGGFVMAKAYPGIDYSGLNSPLVKVVYDAKAVNFDDDETSTEAGLQRVMKISEAERTLFERFCNTNKEGDEALRKPDCPLAKQLYEKAITIIPGESYPVEQLKKVGECLQKKEEVKLAEQKAKEEKDKQAAEEAKKKEEKALADAKAKEEKALADAKAKEEKALADAKAKEEKATADAKAKEEKATADAKAKEEKALADAKKKEEKALADAKKNEEKKLAEAKKKEEKPAPAEPKKEAKTETKTENKNELTITNPGTESGNTNVSVGESKHKVRPTLGADNYQKYMREGEDHMRMKRFKEAKAAFENALKLKPNDSFTKNKLAEAEKNLK